LVILDILHFSPSHSSNKFTKTSIFLSFFNAVSTNWKGQLKDTIVYIDDPISSLDSNHVFQINSLLKDTFYKYAPSASNPSQHEWIIACKQLATEAKTYRKEW